MIYKYNNNYYLKKGNGFELANIDIKVRGKRKTLVITGTGIFEQIENAKEYSYKELEKELIK